MELRRWAIVMTVWILICYEASTYIAMFGTVMFTKVQHLNTEYRLSFYLLIPLFSVILLMICLCYYRSTATDPGHPQLDINSHYENCQEIKENARTVREMRKQLKSQENQDKIDEIEVLRRVSWCFKCDRIKEVRVHHCKVCQKCILRMDHHCPWIGNCVGKMNHKYFMQFLFYATIGLVFISLHILVDYLQGGIILNEYEDWARLNIMICGMTSGALSASIGFLFMMQLRGIGMNLTTVETYVEGIQNVKPWIKKSFRENVEEVCGKSSWLLPTNPFPHGQSNLVDSIDM